LFGGLAGIQPDGLCLEQTPEEYFRCAARRRQLASPFTYLYSVLGGALFRMADENSYYRVLSMAIEYESNIWH